MTTTCADLQAFFDGELDRATSVAFRIHLADCPACQRDLDSAMQLVMASSPIRRRELK